MTNDDASIIVDNCAAMWREQRKLCDALESIADSLPDNVDRQTCMHAARALPPLIDRAHRFEENVLFIAIEEMSPVLLDLRPTLARLKLEHVGDEYSAEELSEVLMSYGEGTPMHTAEATGYLLRGFFEALRRHIAIEEELTSILTTVAAAQNRANPLA